MEIKQIVIVALLFSVQLISSCCSQSETFNVEIEAVSIVTSSDVDTNNATKDLFPLFVSISQNNRKVSLNDNPKGNSLRANANPFNTCGDSYNVIHRISEFKLYVQEPESGEIKIVNDAFGIEESTLIVEIMNDDTDRGPFYYPQFFELQNPSSVPTTCKFIIEIIVETGEVFSAETPVIHFEE